MKKPVIFITIDRAAVIRNLLFNKYFDILKSRFEIVLFTPHVDNEIIRQKFSDCKIEKLHYFKLTKQKNKILKLLISIHKALIYNSTVELRTKNGAMCGADVKFKRLRIFTQKYIFGKLLSFKQIRSFFKYVDKLLFDCNVYDEIIEKYTPALVFITSIISDEEVALLRNCKKKGVESVAMAKSWDNLSKLGFREKANKLLVWGDYMKDEAMKYQDYKEHDIEVVGVPQFDYYVQLEPLSREKLCKKFNLDISKKIIFFGSEGPICKSDPYVVLFLKKKIIDKTLSGYQVLVRPHYSFKEDEKRFLSLIDNKTVFLDNEYTRSNFKDRTELSLNTIVNLMSEVVHADISITSASTLVLDIAANNKYPILYAFDEDPNVPYKDSTKRRYTSLWMKEIIKMGINNLAYSEEELIEKIKIIEKDHKYKAQELINLKNRLCYKVDGRSGERLFGFIKKIAEENINIKNEI